MSHRLIFVFIADPCSGVFEQIHSLLAPHSELAKVKPYKYYFEPSFFGQTWEDWTKEDFAHYLRSKFAENYEFDDQGVYYWEDANYRDGQYDSYSIGGRWDGFFAGLCELEIIEFSFNEKVQDNICPVKVLPVEALAKRYLPSCIVTPNGEWIDLDEVIPDTTRGQRVQQLVNTYKDYYAVAVDIHI